MALILPSGLGVILARIFGYPWHLYWYQDPYHTSDVASTYTGISCRITFVLLLLLVFMWILVLLLVSKLTLLKSVSPSIPYLYYFRICSSTDNNYDTPNKNGFSWIISIFINCYHFQQDASFYFYINHIFPFTRCAIYRYLFVDSTFIKSSYGTDYSVNYFYLHIILFCDHIFITFGYGLNQGGQTEEPKQRGRK